MTFIDIRNLQQRRQERDSRFEDTRDIRNGYLFEVNGSIEGDRSGLVWFKALDGNSEPFQVFYNGVIGDLRGNMYVKIERHPKSPSRWQIIEFDTGIYFDDQSAFEQLPSTSLIPDKEDYEWPPGYPGAKALNIFPRAITDFAVRPTSPPSMKARVHSGIYPGATNYARFQGPVNTKDFTADVPGAGLARLAAISIDSTGTLNYTNGTTFVDGLPMPDASLPAVPASEMLISAVRLVNGMTAIEESNFDLEMRPLMANGTVNVKVSELWESDFGAVAMTATAVGNIGINSTSAPHGGVGAAKLAIDGTNASTAGPHMQFTTASDDFPLLQILPFEHDNTQLLFDAYYDGTSRSSDLGSNFRIQKASDTLRLCYDSGVATGAAITWNNAGLVLDTSGRIGIGTPSPADLLEVEKATGNLNVKFQTLGAASNSGLILENDDQAWLLSARGTSTPAESLFIRDNTGGANIIIVTTGKRMGINAETPLATAHIDQDSTTAAIPALLLDQADLSEEFIDFQTTIGAGNPIDTAAIGTYYGKARVAVNGTFKFVALYNS